MDTSRLKKFAQYARRYLREQMTTKLEVVLGENSAARRENPKAISKLAEKIEVLGKEQLIEQVAYTWFNRFCALRFMDSNRYHSIRVVSAAEGQFQPEILAEAKTGHIDEEMLNKQVRKHIFDLLSGTAPSYDAQGEAYRSLIVGVCNYYHQLMPYLFERIDDYTELLMPDDLLSGNSILAYTREAMTPENCESVEVIGWLYQFYISEKKDEVFEGLKNNKKITPQNIPAATQLFTPHWIVRYLVENSLGRLWMLNRPQSRLVESMSYYVDSEKWEVGDGYLKINSPEDIKICDPACGSGHILVYAFDLLYAIYEEEGYTANEIPSKILTHNLYGIEIDERAGSLAAFALTMKAREKERRFFRKPIQPNICVLKKVEFSEKELQPYLDFVGRDLFTAPLLETLHEFKEADNFGALIRPTVTDVQGMIGLLNERNVASQLLLYKTHEKVIDVLNMADFLSPKYHLVVANPPYMGNKGMNNRLKAFLQDNYSEVKSDLFSAFMVRCLELCKNNGFTGFMTPFTWMFLSSYEKLRTRILSKSTITSLVRPEYHAFFESAYVPICAFTLYQQFLPNYKGAFIDLQQFYGVDIQPVKALEAIKNPNCGWFYRASASDFKKIPGNAIAYWVSDRVLEIFATSEKLENIAKAVVGLQTGDNDRFLRLWFEVEYQNIGFNLENRKQAQESQKKWFPYNKGGEFRKWYGNQEYLVNWENGGQEIANFKPRAVIRNPSYYFQESITWSFVSSSCFGVRFSPKGFIFDVGGSSLFTEQENMTFLTSLLCSKIAFDLMKIMNPTLNFQVGNVASIPIVKNNNSLIETVGVKSISLSRQDWNSYETSWDFTTLPLLRVGSENLEQNTRFPLSTSLKETYQNLRQKWQEMTLAMQKLEEENNGIFIEAYGLQDELTPEVPLKEITLTCNPHYRYKKEVGSEKWEVRNKEENITHFPIDEDLEKRLLADTIKEFISYSVGCMFGRYSLDKEGLILANQGETLQDYLKQIPNPTFPPTETNVIPILEGDWFSDDITEQFRQFLRLTFGEKNYQQNLNFIEEAIGKSLEKYFLKDFYDDHTKRYKKRPIYWLFSSPKGTFNALIYLHRYRPDTVNIVLNSYLREFRLKLEVKLDTFQQIEISTSATKTEKTKALRESEQIKKMIRELETYEQETLYPLAIAQKEIDLDDGVKVNYTKLGKALKNITGLG
ncbi:BREX-1 system adenine-specific DNA-methyltransferase PglX [Microcystis sp. BLCC-F210]|uniref:BREX-1 system adenine-specific DNA-methyltransferase PglX n=1 Tax=Microcystis sp. BLCC-F210 TaxID=3342751 RepID=UPI0035C8B8E5